MPIAAWLIGLSLIAAAPSNTHLAQAEKLVDNLKYSDAAKALVRARSDASNDRPTLLRILELTAVVEASLGRRDPSTEAFKALLSIAPDYKLGDEWGPKVRTPYYEAKGWVGDHGSLSFTAQPAQTEPGKVLQLGVAISQDALKLSRAVRFHVVGQPNPSEVPVVDGAKVVAPAPPLPSVGWWAELVGDHGEVLEQLASEQSPLKAEAPPALVVNTPPVASQSAAQVAATPPPGPPAGDVAASAPSEGQPTLRPLAYGLAAGGAAALGVGLVFGLMQHGDQGQLDNATRDSQGHVTGLTQKAALNLQSSANTDGLIADVLFATGAVAVAAGVGVWFWGRPSASPGVASGPASSSLALSLAPERLVLSGTFP